MTTQITWLIEQMQVAPQLDGQTDVVVIASWRCNGINQEYLATVYGAVGFTLQQGQPFTPYNELTQDQVLNWCWQNGVDKVAVEVAVEQAIQNQINPPVITPPLPWA